MPIYESECVVCGEKQEHYRSVDSPEPEHCGKPMQRLMSVCGSAFVTGNGNWYRRTAAAGTVWKGGGRPKPRTISRGHGLGGRRKPPSIRQQIAQADPNVRAGLEAVKAQKKGVTT